MTQGISFKGIVEKFPGLSGWIYVKVPKDILPKHLPTGHWGYTKISASTGKTTWETSLLPMGNGERFIALKAEVRKKEKIKIDDEIRVSFSIKE